MSRLKVAIIALDGASPELVERWTASGDLPSLAALRERGVFGPLPSVVPPVTGAAWGSFLTGVNPGRHGVFEWLKRRERSYRLGLINGSALARPTLFEHLSRHGVRVGTVSVPLTYPPRPIEGFIVTGLLTPPRHSYTYPLALQTEIERALGEPYPVAPPPWPGRPRAKRWLAALKASVDTRGRAAFHLATRHPWDLFMVHFMETDSVQHQMWHLIDGIERPRYRVQLGGDPILDIYRAVDRWVGELAALFDEDTLVLVISDHGFGPHLYNLHLNTWLLRQGFLRLKRDVSSRLKRLMFAAGIVPENLYPWQERLRLLGQVGGERAYRWLARFALSMPNVDWSRTMAYSYGNVGQVFLNLKDREPEGIVGECDAERVLGELEEALCSWRNPENGERVVRDVYRKAEIYSEQALESAPDLIFLPQDGYSPMGLSEFLSHESISYPVAHSGWHQLNGLFLGAGGPLHRGPTPDLRLLDLYPTICELMGVPVPKDLDGQVAEGLFEGVKARSLAPRRSRPDEPERRAPTQASPTSEEEIRERLKGLGYL